MINISELYRAKTDKPTKSFKLKRVSLVQNTVVEAKQRQEQIRKNNEQINKIIRQKKFYLQHQIEQDDEFFDPPKTVNYKKSKQLFSSESKSAFGNFSSRNHSILRSESKRQILDLKSVSNIRGKNKGSDDIILSDLKTYSQMVDSKLKESSPSPSDSHEFADNFSAMVTKSRLTQYNTRMYYDNTKTLINQAVKVLDGEKAYNEANLDQYLMGIRKLRVEKKPKLLPAINEVKILSKADETFYQQYQNNNDLEHLSPLTPFNQTKTMNNSPTFSKKLDSRSPSIAQSTFVELDTPKYVYQQPNKAIQGDYQKKLNISVSEFYNKRPVIQNKNQDLDFLQKLDLYKEEEQKPGFKLMNFDEIKNYQKSKFAPHNEQKLMKGTFHLPHNQFREKTFVNQIYGETLQQQSQVPSKYFDKITDLYSDYEQEPLERPDSSDDENVNRQVSVINDWNGATIAKRKPDRNYIIEQWDEEEDVDLFIKKKEIGLEEYAKQNQQL